MIDLTYYKEIEERIDPMLTEKEVETTFNVLLFQLASKIHFSTDYGERESKELRKIIKKLNSLESFFNEIVFETDKDDDVELAMHEEIFTLKHECAERLEEIYHQELMDLIEIN